MKLQAIANIAEICFQQGITKAILSPGSRCAPLTIAFVRHPKIDTYTISDERSAAFIGLGMANHLQQPVVLICTSGSAAYNYAPAIAEAFFRHIPLLVLTADRPPEWIDQWDGQTIRQQEIYGKHIIKSYQLPVVEDNADSVWHSERIVSEAINLCSTGSKGPVHINIPLREPFYPSREEPYKYSENIKVINETVSSSQSLSSSQMENFSDQWKSFDRKLIVAGQSDTDILLNNTLTKISETKQCVVAADVLANLYCKNKIQYHDTFLAKDDQALKEALRPSLLVTFGLSIISKNLKLFLREFTPKVHWHISPQGEVGDPFKSLTNIIRTSPIDFFASLSTAEDKDAFQSQKVKNYFNLWHIEDKKALDYHQAFFSSVEFGEFKAIESILKQLPASSDLHVANSMAVRYVSIIAKLPRDLRVFANRGTSGIDGSNSTAVGTALASGKFTTLLTGDMAFFYDRNAFWHNYPIENLRVVILNNHGGGIFRLIKGPSEQPELEEYFETRQALSAKNTAADFGFEYYCASDRNDLFLVLEDFFKNNGQAKILEVFSNSTSNQELFNQYKNNFINYGE